mmetsp:Transcript_11202/g.15713  ORF Transcript_11202/g.15713 Transcript_11202/m.15713 type:complete len:164 (-) Transcript_11202:59-550(-)
MYVEPDQEKATICQFSRQAKLKYLFYATHRLMQQPSSISKGAVILYICKGRGQFDLNALDRIRIKQTAKLVKDCIPIQVRAVHLLFSKNSIVIELVLPSAKPFWSPEIRQRLLHHDLTDKKSLLEALESYGFCKAGLPVCCGGTYKFNTSWVQEQMNDDSENE